MSPWMNRRIFLRWLAIQLGAVAGSKFLAACSQATSLLTTAFPTSTDIPGPTSVPSAVPVEVTEGIEATRSPEITPTEVAATLASYPELAVARVGEPEKLVEAAIAALGGMERFVKSGDQVIVKPNICVAYHTYEYAATTNPWVVGALVKLCLEAGAKSVKVMDFPFGGTSEQAYIRSGIQEQVLAAGGEMEAISSFKFVETEIPEGVDLKICDIYDEVLSADVVINVPIAKDHGLARLTLGMKNLMGVIRDRPAMHRNLGQRLADLTSRVRPALTVVDAVRMLTWGGPSGGSLDAVKKMDTVIASPDIVAADSYAATLFNINPMDLSYIQAGVSMGLGRSDLGNMKIEEINIGA
ncbi:MAG: hypothetical protein A2Z14_18195 [Chloroflexi bacterium RBG_16_48_8]|nr:MAG: hypothetical protein A2Z14_18195 [Chloroflexi bacterium RBG_16_48_8]